METGNWQRGNRVARRQVAHEEMPMIVNIEFFDIEPIENVITSLNYQMDKTIFFGYEEVMKPYRDSVEKFLKTVCAVREVEFYPVSSVDLTGIIQVISDVVQKEKAQGNHVYFDLTGGESLPLVAFGILAKTFAAPMYMFDIRTNELREFCCGESALSVVASKRQIKMNLDQFISLYNGVINYRQKKSFKSVSEDSAADIENMWKLSRNYGDKWVHYASVLRKFPPDGAMTVKVESQRFVGEFRKNPRAGKIKDFHKFLAECGQLGFLKVFAAGKKGYHFRYKDSVIKELFWDSGSILEMYAYLLESRREETADCRVGVHIDWDGVIHSGGNQDVLNEIDVMAIRNNLPVFMSCKIGHVDQMALYELETVANRFGGKYATKILATAQIPSEGHMRRAKEMGIEVRILT